MNFEEAHQILLKEFDRACQALRAVHEDSEHLGHEDKVYQSASQRFMNVTRDLFEFKKVWDSITRLQP
jgi:hypothetical protein